MHSLPRKSMCAGDFSTDSDLGNLMRSSLPRWFKIYFSNYYLISMAVSIIYLRITGKIATSLSLFLDHTLARNNFTSPPPGSNSNILQNNNHVSYSLHNILRSPPGGHTYTVFSVAPSYCHGSMIDGASADITYHLIYTS